MNNRPNTKSYYQAAALAAVLLGGLLAACTTTPAPYGPSSGRGGTGYTDERLAQNRYRVTYSGNSATPRALVEDYLLYHAAEVTAASGYSAFEFDTRDTRARTTYLSSFQGYPDWYWHPRPFGWYWHSWPYGTDLESRPITRYEAYAEIVMLTAEQAKNEPRALDARDVMNRLGPRVLPPSRAKS